MNKVKKIITASITGGLLGLLSIRGISCVPAGHVRVLDTFGSVESRELNPGIHFPINPFASRVALDVRTKEMKESMQVPTKEGLIAGLDVSILYRLQADKASDIYSTVGQDYSSVIVEPVLRNVTRDVVSGYTSEDLYGPNRPKISSEIESKLKTFYNIRGIELESVLLRDVKLPAEVTSAIETKIKSKQAAEQMEYVLDKEKSEASRREIEAGGIAKAQGIISQSLTQEYLQWKYIEAIQDMTTSQNNTCVIMPYDSKLMPILPLDKK